MTTKPEMKPVESSMVNAVGYDEPSQTLWVEYKGGKLYTYANVDAVIWNAAQAIVETGASIGQWINKTIKPNYPATKVD